jgi:flavin-dependent dehydrogenase
MAIGRNELDDVAIIGGGPAGASAAITAARYGARVVVLESGEFPRHKVCGEFVSAESLDILRDLLAEVSQAESRLGEAPAINQVRLIRDRRSTTTAVSPAGLSLPRYDLDALLWRAAQQTGVQARAGCEVRAIQGGGPFQLDTSQGTIEASSVVVAAGRWSRFRPKIAAPAGPKWIGIKAHFREQQPCRSSDLYFFEHGYCGVQPVSAGVVNACAMVRSDRAKSLEEVLVLSPALAERSRNWQPLMEPVTTAPLIYRTPQPVRDNLMFVGDAAAFIDPFVGDGISIALRTGQLAAGELQRALQNSTSLTTAVANYQEKYERYFVPLITAASRIRHLLSWPKPAQFAVLELLRLPGLMSYLIRSTRRSH